MKWEPFLRKNDIYNLFHTILACDYSQIIILYASYDIQIYFTLICFTKYIVIFKIYMPKNTFNEIEGNRLKRKG